MVIEVTPAGTVQFPKPIAVIVVLPWLPPELELLLEEEELLLEEEELLLEEEEPPLLEEEPFGRHKPEKNPGEVCVTTQFGAVPPV